jgi:hypothetical protein
MRTYDRMLELKSYEQMCRAAQAATVYFEKACLADPLNIPAGKTFRIRDIRDCHEDLEKTYLVRVFARFEGTLREYWRMGCGRRSHPLMKVLLDNIAGRRYMPDGVLTRAHAVRDYRNSIVHGGDAPAVTLGEARSYLCTFLYYLPRQW